MVPARDGALSDGEKAFQSGLRLLSARGRSRHELSTLLERRGHGPADRAEAIARLAQLGYLDDERFARALASSLIRTGRFGEAVVLKRLTAHALSAEQAEAAFRWAVEEHGYQARECAAGILAKRGLSGSTRSLKQRAQAARLLAARGFTEELIESLLGNLALDSEGSDG